MFFNWSTQGSTVAGRIPAGIDTLTLAPRRIMHNTLNESTRGPQGWANHLPTTKFSKPVTPRSLPKVEASLALLFRAHLKLGMEWTAHFIGWSLYLLTTTFSFETGLCRSYLNTRWSSGPSSPTELSPSTTIGKA